MSTMIKIGSRVKYSDHGTRRWRDYYLGLGGSRREQAKWYYEERLAMQGTVTFLGATQTGCTFAKVNWDNGSKSETMFGGLALVE